MLSKLAALTLITITTQIKNAASTDDIGCNYINLAGVAMPTDYCMTIIEEDTTYAMKFNCNDTWNGMNLEVWIGDKCSGDPVFVEDSHAFWNQTTFYCDSLYKITRCDEVSLEAYPGGLCSGDYSELRFITDACIRVNEKYYQYLTCSEVTADLALYETWNMNGCVENNYINTTTILEGGSLDDIGAGCVKVEGCYDTLNPVISDIGCNYVNLGGIAMPTRYCMDIDDGDFEYSIKWNCNDSWTGMNIEVWYESGCPEPDEPAVVVDYSEYSYFWCEPDKSDRRCDEVSLTAYTGGVCSGASSEIRLITNACIYSSDNHYNMLTCDDTSATLTRYITNTGICAEEDVLNYTVIEEGSLDSESFGCISVDGCYGEESSKPNFIGCNYMSLSGMGVPTGECTTVVLGSEGLTYSFALVFECNNAWNNEMYQRIYYNTNCKELSHDDSVDEVSSFTIFEADFWCSEDVAHMDCQDVVTTTVLEVDLVDAGCEEGVLSVGTFITNECLYNFDLQEYEVLECNDEDATATISYYNDQECNLEELTQIIELTNGETRGTIFEDRELGCVRVSFCEEMTDNSINYTLYGVIGGVSGCILIIICIIVGFYIRHKKLKKQTAQIKHVQLDENIGDNDDNDDDPITNTTAADQEYFADNTNR